MQTTGLKRDTVLKKSPFLATITASSKDIRVYSRLHGHFTVFDYDIHSVFKQFDAPIMVSEATDRIAPYSPHDPLNLIEELYTKRFLVQAHTSEAELVLTYLQTVGKKLSIPQISKVTFLLSANCNLACKGCYHTFFDFKNKEMRSDLASQVLQGLFAFSKQRDIQAFRIAFLGYEPLLSFKVLADIYAQSIKMAVSQSIDTHYEIFTNAFRVDDTIHNWIKRNKSRLQIKVSLDGIKKDNDQRRVDFSGSGTYDRVVDNLKRFLGNGVECGVLIVLSKLNFANIEAFVDEMAAIGIRNITANMFCGHTKAERQLELTESEKVEAIKQMELATEKCGIKFDGEWKFAVLQMIKGAQFSCPAGTKQLVFSADGVIYPCQRFAGTTVHFGNYDDHFWQSLLMRQCQGYNQWIADIYNDVAQNAQRGKMDLAGWSCPFVPFMQGGCLNENYERDFNQHLIDFFAGRPLHRIHGFLDASVP